MKRSHITAPRIRCTIEKIYTMSKNTPNPIQKLRSISCRLVSLNLMYVFDIRVPNAVNPTITYIPRKYNNKVLRIRIISPADHPIILSLIKVNARVNVISANGRIYTKNFLRENIFDLMIYTIGIHTAMTLQITNFRLARLANIP